MTVFWTMFWFVVSVFGVYRVAFMIAREDGPFDACSKLRAWVGQGNWVGRGMHCVLCVSFWLAVPAGWFVEARDLLHSVPLSDALVNGLLIWLGIAGGVLFIHRVSERMI